MKVRYCMGSAMIMALVSAARADLIGNPLVAGTDATDLQPYVYNVYYDSPMISAGTIDAVSIYQMEINDASGICDSFTLRLLHYTGVGQIYEQYYVSPTIGLFGPVNSVQTYWLGQDVQVQAGDLFVTYGQGIPFTASSSTGDTYYFTGDDFAPTGNGFIDLSGKPYTGNRVYAAAVDFTAAPGSASVPEPSSFAIAGAGIVGLLARRRTARPSD